MTHDQPEGHLFSPARFGPGGGNPRTATSIHIVHTSSTVLIQTLLPGLKPETVQVTLSRPHLIIEGALTSNETRGRYIRHVPDLPTGPYRQVETTYAPEGQLIIVVMLKQAES